MQTVISSWQSAVSIIIDHLHFSFVIDTYMFSGCSGSCAVSCLRHIGSSDGSYCGAGVQEGESKVRLLHSAQET